MTNYQLELFNTHGYAIKRVSRKSNHQGQIDMPKELIGRKVKVILLDDDDDDG